MAYAIINVRLLSQSKVKVWIVRFIKSDITIATDTFHLGLVKEMASNLVLSLMVTTNKGELTLYKNAVILLAKVFKNPVKTRTRKKAFE